LRRDRQRPPAPTAAPGAATDVRRDTPPEIGPVEPFRFPAYTRARLANGLGVLAARTERGPLAELALLFPAGAERETPEIAGAATLLGGMLDEGTAGRSALDIAGAVEELGGRLTTGADWDVGSLSMQVLSRHTGEALRLVAELATGSTLPPEELDRQRRRRLAELLRKKSDPSHLAAERFSRAVYGDTAYGHTLLGDEESVGRLDRDRLLALYREGYALSGAVLVAVGDLDPDAVIADAAEVLGGLPGGTAPAPPVLRPPALSGRRVEIVDRPSAAQTELRLGHAGVPRSHPDFLALSVLNAILGGKFTSRINLNLRERHGYTYGAHSSFASRRGPGPFQVSTAVANDVAGAAASEVLHELRRLQEEPVGPQELADAVRYLEGVFPYTLQTVESVAQRLAQLAVFDLPDDHFDRYPAELRAVDAAAIQDLARRHLRPEACAIVAVGPAETLLAQLERFGPVTVSAPGGG
jgi:zinc protease